MDSVQQNTVTDCLLCLIQQFKPKKEVQRILKEMATVTKILTARILFRRKYYCV
jgi:hypothetical protein